MNNTKYFKIYAIINAVLFSIYTVIYCIFLWIKYSIWDNFLFISLFLIPLIFSLVLWLIGHYTSKKHPKITKAFAHILNNLVILLHGFFSILMLMAMSAFTYGIDHDEYADIKDYAKALNKFYPESVYYFPNPIPEEAKNIEMLKTPSSLTGDTMFYLKFDASENYIKDEMKKYKNIGKEYLINKNDNPNKKYDYYEEDAAGVVYSIVHNDDIGYKIRVLERSSCLSGIATKHKTIIYIMYCD